MFLYFSLMAQELLKLMINEKTMEFKAGDSFFVSAGLRSIIIKGQATMVVTRV